MSYFRCQYSDDQGLQCETWFDEAKSGQTRFCPDHNGIICEKLAADPDVKERYIDVVNKIRVEVSKMTLEEIDVHIAGLEKIIELERTKLLTSRSVRADKIDKLSDEEREVRRATKVSRAVSIEKRSSRAAKLPSATKGPSKPTIKSDPIAYLMVNYGMTKEMAESQIGVKK